MESNFLDSDPLLGSLGAFRSATDTGSGNGDSAKPAVAGGSNGGGPLVATEAAEPDDGEPLPKTHRDHQRGALQELVELTTQCADLQIEIDNQLSGSMTDAQAKRERALADAERKLKKLQEQIAQKYDEKRVQIEMRYKQNLAAIKSNDKNARSRATGENDAVQQDIKQKYEQAIWLADSVLEAAEGKVAEELKKARDLYASNNELLTGKEKDALELMARYSQALPQSEPLASVKAAEEQAQDSSASFTAHKETIDAQLKALESLSIPKLFVGGKHWALATVIVLVATAVPVGLAFFQTQALTFDIQQMVIYGGSALLVMAILIFFLSSVKKKQINAAFIPLRRALDAARIANQNVLDRATMDSDVELAKAQRQQKMEMQNARDTAAPVLEKAAKRKEAALQKAHAELEQKMSENEAERKNAQAELETWRTRKTQEVQQSYETELKTIDSRATGRQGDVQLQFDTERAALENRWADGLKRIREPINENGTAYLPWNDPAWNNWTPSRKFVATVRFGDLQVDLQTILSDLGKTGVFSLPLPGMFNVPALLAFPRQASLLIHTDRAGRMDALRTLQMVMTRLLTCLPPGRVRLTMIDPVGLGQNFAGFMHLADHDEALVGGKIWTEADQIDKRLEHLTEHMETVIQKYLRNEFATIDDYNAQAGELAEPYRFLVIADYPVKFSDEALRRLSSVATTGARCGVYTLVVRDTRENVGSGSHLEDLEAHSVNLVREGDKFVWRDEVFQKFPLVLDGPPTEEELTRILNLVGIKAKEANRVEVAFSNIAPKPPQFWTMKADGDVQVSIGRSGATRLQFFKLGKGVAQHALVAGKTGSGKSTMLHALISNLVMWYSPEEVELYLIDFKKGVEFKTYAMHAVPHARAIAVESDREFGLSVLQRIDQEMARRAELFRPFKSQNLQAYRESSGKMMPRTLLIIDEFQEFFSEDDKLAADAALLLDRVVRQGRAFGVHLLLGSQTIGGSSGLSRSTIGQIAVRIALQTSEADSQMILGDGNSAARLLSRPGEAIYNDQNGLVEGNSPFQVAWLPDEERDGYLDAVSEKAKHIKNLPPPPIVFEGNEPADYRKNMLVQTMLAAPKYTPIPVATTWLGDPVAIKDPTAIPFRRQSGSNIIIIGQNDESALAIMAQAILALGVQLSPAEASFYILDGNAADSPLFGSLNNVAQALPHTTHNVEYRNVSSAIHEIALELANRQGSDIANPPSIFIFVYGLQRFRNLRKSEESFSFSSSGDEEKPPDTGKEFADIMRDGPAQGIHVIGWIDTATALDRTIDRGSMRELDHRILFQMSAADSSNLVDSPVANKLGPNRALAYSEEQGSVEKFRPYAMPDAKWLAEVKERLAIKAQGG